MLPVAIDQKKLLRPKAEVVHRTRSDIKNVHFSGNLLDNHIALDFYLINYALIDKCGIRYCLFGEGGIDGFLFDGTNGNRSL